MTWGGRTASRLCPNRVRVRTASRENVLRYAWSVVRVKVSAWYECYWVVLIHPSDDSLRVGALRLARYDHIKKAALHSLIIPRPRPQAQPSESETQVTAPYAYSMFRYDPCL